MTTPAERVALGQRLTTKLAFLHAAHNFAVHPSASHWIHLAATMQAHQDAMFPSIQAVEAQQRLVGVQALEHDRLAERMAGI